MSSTNKTNFLGLNSWIGSDVPKRADFNQDNALIDEAVGNHIQDNECHVSESDRSKWDNNMYMFTYFGDGTSSRSVDTGCPFSARFALVFAANKPVADTDFDSSRNNNYFAVAASSGHTIGVTLSNGTKLTVLQSTSAEVGNEYCNMNAKSVIYTVIMFR